MGHAPGGSVVRILAGIVAFHLAVSAALPAQAGVDVRVNLSTQSMSVAVDGALRHRWAISTGRLGYVTPNGTYRPQRLHRHWYSRKYGGAMPYSIFFRGGYAIHGTTEVRRLGRPASHGCIRLHPAHAATLFSLVQANGRAATRIVITGSRPQAPSLTRRRASRAWRDYDERRSFDFYRSPYESW